MFSISEANGTKKHRHFGNYPMVGAVARTLAMRASPYPAGSWNVILDSWDRWTLVAGQPCQSQVIPEELSLRNPSSDCSQPTLTTHIPCHPWSYLNGNLRCTTLLCTGQQGKWLTAQHLHSIPMLAGTLTTELHLGLVPPWFASIYIDSQDLSHKSFLS